LEDDEEPTPTDVNTLPSYVQPYIHLFQKKNFDKLPEHTEWDHEINLTDNAPKELKAKVYPMTVKEREELHAFVKENLESGRIRPSKSPYASPCFFIPKKDGSRRLVQDYRKLNDYTIKDKTPLPLIGELVDKLKDAKYFNKLDIIWGYNNVRIREGDEWKASFLTNEGLFEPTVMFFGLSNSPGTFQRMMACLFRDLLQEGVVVNYMDDFAVPAKSLEELEERTIRVFKVMERHNLYLKPSKCIFNATEIPLLGVIVGNGQVRMEQEKIKAVKEWKEPTNVKGIEKFIGFANFYRRFIKDFSKIAAPLNRLKGKDIAWEWGSDQQKAFDELKRRITSEPVLTLPRSNGKFRMEVDASGYAIGGVLQQEQDGKWHPIAFLSRSMTPAEKNYEIYDKELLAIMEGLKTWRQYLLDATEPFEIWTDHENLKYFREPHRLNARQARWYLRLQDYTFTLRHIPGKTNTKADCLSRMEGLNIGEEDNKDLTLLEDELFIAHMGEEEIIILRNEHFEIIGDQDKVQEIKRTTTRETEVIKGLEKGDGTFWEQDGLVYRKGRIYVPKKISLREQIIRENHDSPEAGHPGIYRTMSSIQRTWWWPSMKAEVRKYLRGCLMCQQNKAQRERKAAPLHPLEVPNGPWEEITIDLIGPLPPSKGHDAILVVVDRFTKMIRLIATETSLTSKGLAELYRDHIWKLHGIPRKVISDRGPQFASTFMKNLCKALGTLRSLSTAYHPQTDGQTERINQEVETFLRHFCTVEQDDWASWLAVAEFQYNDKAHSATQHTPFYLNYGRHPWKGDAHREPSQPAVEDFVKDLERARSEVKGALEEARDRMRTNYDRHRNQARTYQPGDKVFLEATNISTTQPSKKLAAKRYGPFAIKEKIGDGAYRLDLPSNWAIHPVINEMLLTPYHSPAFPNQQTQENWIPDIVGEEEEYEVEEVRDSRRKGRGIQFLVHWKGYPDEEDTWLPKSQLSNATEAIQEFSKRFPEKPI
jgi:transposase InsO family protein